MASSEFVDPYVDPQTGVLRNKVGARTKVALDEAEGDLSFARLVQLVDHPVAATGDLDELRAIHHHLFQDVYEWAGQVRTVNVRKNVEGAEHFLPVSVIDRASVYAAQELRADESLRGYDREGLIERLAYHYDQFNYMHPFREGNGRTQRVFWNRVARDAGWQLDWRGVRGERNDHASRVASEQRDFGPLQGMFAEIVTEAMPLRGRDAAWRAAEVSRVSFPGPATQATRTGRSGGGTAARGHGPSERGMER